MAAAAKGEELAGVLSAKAAVEAEAARAEVEVAAARAAREAADAATAAAQAERTAAQEVAAAKAEEAAGALSAKAAAEADGQAAAVAAAKFEKLCGDQIDELRHVRAELLTCQMDLKVTKDISSEALTQASKLEALLRETGDELKMVQARRSEEKSESLKALQDKQQELDTFVIRCSAKEEELDRCTARSLTLEEELDRCTARSLTLEEELGTLRVQTREFKRVTEELLRKESEQL